MLGFSLGVASALCWSGLDVVRKALAGKASPTALAVFLCLGQLPFLGAWALFDGTWVSDAHYWPPAIASIPRAESREVTLFNYPSPTASAETISREVSVNALAPTE